MDATNMQPIDPRTYDGAGHIMGTCRMGTDRKSSVVDSDCCTHDHRNLFIAGSSVFPTCGSPNPTLTLAALALRTAQHISAQLGAKTKPCGKS
jgi:choline dehydrogenase-like flavoprotein